MKHSVFVFALILLFNSDLHSNPVTWLPERYVEGVGSEKVLDKSLLWPISGIMFDDERNQLFIEGYMGEPKPVKSIKFTIDGIEKYKLLGIEYCINLANIPPNLYDSLVSNIKETTFYLSAYGDKMLLEIVRNNHIKSVFFVNHHHDYKFKTIRDAYKYIAEVTIKYRSQLSDKAK